MRWRIFLGTLLGLSLLLSSSEIANSSGGYYPVKVGEILEVTSCVPKKLQPPLVLQIEGPNTSNKRKSVMTLTKLPSKRGSCANNEVEAIFTWQIQESGDFTLYVYSTRTKQDFFPWPDGVISTGSPKDKYLRGVVIDQMPKASQNNGTFCQSILGQGWYCTVELRVVNKGTSPWNGFLRSNLVSTTGAISAGTNSSSVDYYTGNFNNLVNPGEGYRWNTYFSVGVNQRFTKLNVTENGKIVFSIPVCLGSSSKDELGC